MSIARPRQTIRQNRFQLVQMPVHRKKFAQLKGAATKIVIVARVGQRPHHGIRQTLRAGRIGRSQFAGLAGDQPIWNATHCKSY
jgi:hypothetical protein